MTDISALIKEAKPLYFARKRRNNIIKSSLAMLVGVVMLGSLYSQPQPAWDYSYYFYGVEFSVSENTSVLEDMGFPVDDYGLLMVG